MQPSKNPFKHLSRSERTGALILMGILLTSIVVWRLLPSLIKPVTDPEDARLQEAWGQFIKNRDQLHDTMPKWSTKEKGKFKETLLFYFDPNNISKQDLEKLNLPRRTVETWIKYLSKGGRFYKKEDVKKLYNLTAEDYARIAPYIRLPEPSHKTVKTEYQTHTAKSFDINSATETDLIQLKGIGPVFAARIIKFRDALGGFISVNQLKEVYHLPDSVYTEISPLLYSDHSGIRKININTASVDEFAQHPYISRKLAGNIIRFRNDINIFDSVGQIRLVPLINGEKYRKIAPYLSTH